MHNRLAVGARAQSYAKDEFVGTITAMLTENHRQLYEDAKRFQKSMTYDTILTLDRLRDHFKDGTGFVRAK